MAYYSIHAVRCESNACYQTMPALNSIADHGTQTCYAPTRVPLLRSLMLQLRHVMSVGIP